MFRVKICRVWIMFSDFQIQKIAFLRIKMSQKETEPMMSAYRKSDYLTAYASNAF